MCLAVYVILFVFKATRCIKTILYFLIRIFLIKNISLLQRFYFLFLLHTQNVFSSVCFQYEFSWLFPEFEENIGHELDFRQGVSRQSLFL